MRLGLALVLGCTAVPAGAASCGPTYGADGIAVGAAGKVYAVHYEDPRLLEYLPAERRFRELAAGAVSKTLASQAGRLVDGRYDYSRDKGLAQLAVDENRGIAWATRFESDELLRFDLGTGAYLTLRLPGRVAGVRGNLPLAVDGSVRVLVADNDTGRLENGRVVTVAADGAIVGDVPVPHAAFLSPQLAIDRQGRLWLASSAVAPDGPRPWVFRFDAGHWSGVAIGGGHRFITALAAGADGRIWFSAVGSQAAVGTVAGGKASIRLRLPGKAHPHALAAAADGGIWFADWERHRLGRIDRQGRLREYVLPAGEESPVALVPGRDGKSIWYSVLFNYGLFRLDAASGRVVYLATPVPAHEGATAEVCDARPVPALAHPGPTQRPLRHPADYGEDDMAAVFERNCHTTCHTWYRVEQAASRRSDWTATVDRMIQRNGAAFIGATERRQILDYLHAHYAAR